MELQLPSLDAPDKPAPFPLLSNYSLEMTAHGLTSLQAAAYAIAPDTRISITFLPNEDYAARIQAAQEARRLGFVPVPHISARRIGSEDELERFLSALSDRAGVDEVLVVGGDPARSMGPYEDALALIESGILQRHGIHHAGITGYPAGHPDIPGARLREATRLKLQGLRKQGIEPFITTQFGFETAPIVGWVSELRAQGVRCPIRVGVAGPAKASTLLRYAAHCGVGASAQIMGRYGLSLARLVNTVGPTALVSELMHALDERSVRDVFLHFYSFGSFQDTVGWIRSFREACHG